MRVIGRRKWSRFLCWSSELVLEVWNYPRSYHTERLWGASSDRKGACASWRLPFGHHGHGQKWLGVGRGNWKWTSAPIINVWIDWFQWIEVWRSWDWDLRLIQARRYSSHRNTTNLMLALVQKYLHHSPLVQGSTDRCIAIECLNVIAACNRMKWKNQSCVQNKMEALILLFVWYTQHSCVYIHKHRLATGWKGASGVAIVIDLIKGIELIDRYTTIP